MLCLRSNPSSAFNNTPTSYFRFLRLLFGMFLDAVDSFGGVEVVCTGSKTARVRTFQTARRFVELCYGRGVRVSEDSGDINAAAWQVQSPTRPREDRVPRERRLAVDDDDRPGRAVPRGIQEAQRHTREINLAALLHGLQQASVHVAVLRDDLQLRLRSLRQIFADFSQFYRRSDFRFEKIS